MVSRNVPPWAAVITIMPAVGGPSRTVVHSSGAKAAFVVMSSSCVPQGFRLRRECRARCRCASPARGERMRGLAEVVALVHVLDEAGLDRPPAEQLAGPRGGGRLVDGEHLPEEAEIPGPDGPRRDVQVAADHLGD